MFNKYKAKIKTKKIGDSILIYGEDLTPELMEIFAMVYEDGRIQGLIEAEAKAELNTKGESQN